MKKILTIIIPTYNMEKYLRRCLESLLVKDEVTRQLLEILIINDGSKDSSLQIAQAYEKNNVGVIKTIDKETSVI